MYYLPHFPVHRDRSPTLERIEREDRNERLHRIGRISWRVLLAVVAAVASGYGTIRYFELPSVSTGSQGCFDGKPQVDKEPILPVCLPPPEEDRFDDMQQRQFYPKHHYDAPFEYQPPDEIFEDTGVPT